MHSSCTQSLVEHLSHDMIVREENERVVDVVRLHQLFTLTKLNPNLNRALGPNSNPDRHLPCRKVPIAIRLQYLTVRFRTSDVELVELTRPGPCVINKFKAAAKGPMRYDNGWMTVPVTTSCEISAQYSALSAQPWHHEGSS
jgi:hypothetical protein